MDEQGSYYKRRERWEELLLEAERDARTGTLKEQYIKALRVAGIPCPESIDDNKMYQWAIEMGILDDLPKRRSIDDDWEDSSSA